MIDIVCPDGNEEVFVDAAISLGYDGLCFLYSDVKAALNFKSTKLKVFYGCVVSDQKKIFAARKRFDFVVALASKDSRGIVEELKPDVMLGVELVGRKEYTHFRGSGLNQVVCKVARDKKCAFGLSFFDMLNCSSPGSRAVLLGRVSQNIRFFRKYRNDVVFGSFARKPIEMRNPSDLCSLLAVLGMHPAEAASALSCVSDIIALNHKRKSGRYVSEGVEIV